MSSPGDKPLDLGTGRVCASFDSRTAAWLSIGAPHDVHGFVELAALPPFDEVRRGDPSATRAHRLRMTQGEFAWLVVELDGRRPSLTPDVNHPLTPRWFSDGIDVRASAPLGSTTLRQEWTIRTRPAGVPQVRLIVRGTLDRPALAEITELNPPATTGAKTVWTIADGAVRARAAALPAACTVTASGCTLRWSEGGGALVGMATCPDGSASLDLVLEVTLSEPNEAIGTGDPVPVAASGDLLTDRALAYVRACTALAVGPDERTMLTDHRILPLSWTRDAYWQALALLAAGGTGDRDRVADHLRWLWRRCDRPDGRWVRSHHANGRRKDLAFQADQQLYPILELCDYWRLEGALPGGVAWREEVRRAWNAALGEVDSRVGMIASAENAADDPATAPFIAGSQILLWYTALRLAELARAGGVDLDVDELLTTATATRDAFGAQLASQPGAWAYAVDTAGSRVAYHDANDLPVALAPLWGFCTPDDPGWLATMEFAFGPANPGWRAGARSGLGSLHTPGPWTLGDIQAWIRARATGDAASASAALDRLREVAFVDGMLPEAYETDGDARIRHWFAWPGAAIAAMRLLDADGRLAERMAVHRAEEPVG